LEVWRKYNNNQLPKKLVLYCGGVSEGQYALVLQLEPLKVWRKYDLRAPAHERIALPLGRRLPRELQQARLDRGALD
jgi:hypothetical protein